jgi:DNA-binding MarR family transcriptional regulator
MIITRLKRNLLSASRKKILVYWYQFHKESNLWPTLREAALDIDLAYTTIRFHLKKLEDEGWIITIGNRSALTKFGERKIREAELISLGNKKLEEHTLIKKIIKTKIKKKDA